jgi:hypothetical protein
MPARIDEMILHISFLDFGMSSCTGCRHVMVFKSFDIIRGIVHYAVILERHVLGFNSSRYHTQVVEDDIAM